MKRARFCSLLSKEVKSDSGYKEIIKSSKPQNSQRVMKSRAFEFLRTDFVVPIGPVRYGQGKLPVKKGYCRRGPIYPVKRRPSQELHSKHLKPVKKRYCRRGPIYPIKRRIYFRQCCLRSTHMKTNHV